MKITNETMLTILLIFLIYSLNEKFVSILTQQYSQNETYIQKKFALRFIAGLVLILIGLCVFNDKVILSNNVLKYAFCYAGLFVLINGSIFNWHKITDGTKIIVLSMITFGFMIYSYSETKFAQQILVTAH